MGELNQMDLLRIALFTFGITARVNSAGNKWITSVYHKDWLGSD